MTRHPISYWRWRLRWIRQDMPDRAAQRVNRFLYSALTTRQRHSFVLFCLGGLTAEAPSLRSKNVPAITVEDVIEGMREVEAGVPPAVKTPALYEPVAWTEVP